MVLLDLCYDDSAMIRTWQVQIPNCATLRVRQYAQLGSDSVIEGGTVQYGGTTRREVEASPICLSWAMRDIMLRDLPRPI